MKQTVSPEQMANLTPDAKEKLYQWMKDKGYYSELDSDIVPFTQLTIGQLIEYLRDIDVVEISVGKNASSVHLESSIPDGWDDSSSKELCDALFVTVKNLLEQKN